MNTCQRILLIALVSITTCLNGESITKESLAASGKAEHFENGSSLYESVIQIAATKELPVTLDVTSKGNGELHIGGVKIHIIDNHSNGAFYEKGMLNVALSDINDDGFKDMIISGTVCYTGEKHETVLEREAVVFIYLFNPADGTFIKAYSNASFSLETGSSNGEIYEKYRHVDADSKDFAVEHAAHQARHEPHLANEKSSWVFILGDMGNAADRDSQAVSIKANGKLLITGSFAQAANRTENFILQTSLKDDSLAILISFSAEDDDKQDIEKRLYWKDGPYVVIEKREVNGKTDIVVSQLKDYPRMK